MKTLTILALMMLLTVPVSSYYDSEGKWCYESTSSDGTIKTFCYLGTVTIEAGETLNTEINITLINETEETEDTYITLKVKSNKGNHYGQCKIK